MTRLAAVVLLAAVVTACVDGAGLRSGYPSSDPASGDRRALDWAASMMGAQPQAWVVARPYPGEPDGDPSPWMPEVEPIPFAMTHCRQVDIYKVGDVTRNDAVKLAVLHGVPPWLDPARAFPRRRRGVRLFASPGSRRPAPGCIAAHTSTVTCDNYGDFTVYVLPGAQTWIVANEPAEERVGATQASAPYEPPALPFAPGGTWEETGTVDRYTSS